MTQLPEYPYLAAWVAQQNDSAPAVRSTQIAADIQKFLRDEEIFAIGSSIDAELTALAFT